MRIGPALLRLAESPPGQAWGRFFSASGRSSIPRFAIALALCWLLSRVIWPVFDLDSFAAYAAGGALLGAALAKAVAETGRRLHDAGWGAWAGWTVFGALLWFFWDGMTNTGLDLQRPQQWLALALIALLLLWPGSRRENQWGSKPGLLLPAIGPLQRRAAPLAAMSVFGFALFTWSILHLSHGMREARERTMERLEREDLQAAAHPPGE